MNLAKQTPTLPRKVLLFSGHMIDARGRSEPRFPPDKESIAAEAIAQTIAQVGAGHADLAICGGACGGDLLFAETVLERQLTLELYLPLRIEEFLARSIDFADANWRSRFFAVKSRAALHVTPNELGPVAANQDPYESNNLRMLKAATRFGSEKLDFICLWNGQGGDGPGGTHHLMQEVQNRGGRVYWLNTTQLWKSS
jgi:hypothetical protein